MRKLQNSLSKDRGHIILPKTMRTALQLLLIVFFLAPQKSCKAQIKNSSKVAYVIGENDIETIKSIDDLPKGVVEAAVFITVDNRGENSIKTCSASLLNLGDENPIFVLTNKHCFLYSENNPTNAELCRNTTLYLNPLGLNGLTELSCAENSLHLSPEMDLAVFAIKPDEALADSLALQGLELKFDYKLGDETFLIHYPKTDKDEIYLDDARISVPAPALTNGDCRVIGDFAENLWVQEPQLKYSLSHSCDMTFGSSGSALIDRQSLKIIGINWGGVELNGDDQNRFRNAAITSTHIFSFLESVFELKNIAHLHAKIESHKVNLYANQQQSSNKEKRSCGSLIVRSDFNLGLNSLFSLFLMLILPVAALFLGKRN
ncbi:MAG: hypothetical protein KBD78_10375 [Oligoflexales bacterium]|nr:hypothetical protein [Oligoflexales bacterium]